MTKAEAMHQMRQMEVLQSLGFTQDEAESLRRISMTLRRWFELECGNSDDYGSWAIERDGDEPDSKPYMVRHRYGHGCTGGSDYTTRTPIADRETGARRRLAAILAQRNGRPCMVNGKLCATDGNKLTAYVQTDPRGASLYILRPGDVPQGEDAGAYYSRGISVY